MSRTRVLRWLSVLLVLLALTTLLVGVGRSAQSPEFSERYPVGSPIGPLDLERYLPPEDETQADTPQDATGVYDMNWSRVVFASGRNQHDYDIYIARPEGSSLQQLTSHSANDIEPRLNRGATEIVFASGRTGNWELFRMNSWGAISHS